MTTPDTTLDRSNFVSPVDTLASGNAHVFTGELRLKAKEVLSTMLTEGRFTPVMEIIKKDPSLALETIPWKSDKKGRDPERIDFPFACLEKSHADGYVFAIQHGYPINKMLSNGETLFSLAVTQYSLNGQNGSNIGLLLSMGADPNITAPDLAITGSNLYLVMRRAFPDAFPEGHLGENNPDFALPSAMLDAKVNVKYPNHFTCPLSLVVQSKGWEDSALRPQLVDFMAKLIKAGCDVDFKSKRGSHLATPLQRSVEYDNIHGIISLISLGAKPEINGKSILEWISTDHIPVVHSEIQKVNMQRTIATSISSNEPPKPENRSPRRRIGGI